MVSSFPGASKNVDSESLFNIVDYSLKNGIVSNTCLRL